MVGLNTNADLFPLLHIVVCCSELNKQKIIACFTGLLIHSPAVPEQGVVGAGNPSQERLHIYTQQ